MTSIYTASFATLCMWDAELDDPSHFEQAFADFAAPQFSHVGFDAGEVTEHAKDGLVAEIRDEAGEEARQQLAGHRWTDTGFKPLGETGRRVRELHLIDPANQTLGIVVVQEVAALGNPPVSTIKEAIRQAVADGLDVDEVENLVGEAIAEVN